MNKKGNNMNIKYPVGTNKDKKINKVKTFGNRGMTLEDDLNLTNNYYLEKNIAVILLHRSFFLHCFTKGVWYSLE